MSRSPIFRQVVCCAQLSFLLTPWAHAGCYDECCPTHRAEAADAMVLATVTDIEVLPKGGNRLQTVATLTISEELQGRQIPAQLEVSFPGGELGEITHFDSRHVELQKGGSYLMHLQKNGEQWIPYQASATKIDVVMLAEQKSAFLEGDGAKSAKKSSGTKSDCSGGSVPASQTTSTGYFESSGMPGRWRRCDTGQPILVEIDSEVLPSGISQSIAIAAVRNALDAWEAVSGLSFIITANYDFGQTVKNMNGGETVLHIQLHNSYGEISSTSTLGVGGGSTSSASGGTVGGVAFRKALDRYVVLNHLSSSLEDQNTLAEVLTHEIGHALGLEHSSEDSNETDAILEDATMYFRAHKDGRGAVTNCYDEDRILFAYPEVLPPIAFTRKMRVCTRPSSQPNSPANRIVLEGYSNTGAALSYSFPNGLGSGVGSWSFEPSTRTLEFTPAAYFSDSVATEGSFFSSLEYEVTDGSNSATGVVRIVALRQDNNGSNPDIGANNPLPEAWLEEVFGAAALAANPTNSLFQADGDFDGDGVSNLVEFQMGSDAADASSGPVVVELAEDYSWFELQNAVAGSLLKFELGSDLESWQSLSMLEAEEGTNRIYLVAPTAQRAFFRGEFGN
ncbi:matrixin family metalloprotease [Roseibacillus persicicus]|uniref:matrixin family metalloprotease n=1 Tax=Roseibacillus persicicus TaxID=454148 RepID=UPI00280CE3BE|nr:matrixin family metalloprotease [Roseibacillus persicicus]MDQ8190177.1 matrixin family metalloprotease [Roseibacillus persicicus]